MNVHIYLKKKKQQQKPLSQFLETESEHVGKLLIAQVKFQVKVELLRNTVSAESCLFVCLFV